MDLSLIIPIFNEEKNLLPLYNALTAALGNLSRRKNKENNQYELIFVDDGSRDQSLKVLRDISKRDKKVRVMSFQGNFQKAAALMAGFEAAKGKLILTLDGDLQDNPQEIPRFLRRLEEGYDLVVGWKFKRQDSWAKVIPSHIFNALIRWLFGLRIHDNDCNFRLMKREVIEHLNLYGGMYRYIPVLAYTRGFRVGEIKVEHLPRLHGKSKYGTGRLFKGAFDLLALKFLTKYGQSPLHFFGYLGGGFFFLGTLFGAYLTFIKFFFGEHIGSRPLLLLAILLILLGVQFFSLGLLGEMLVSQSKKREYLIKERIN